MWSVTLSGTDITALVSGVSVTFAAGNVCGECTIELADRSILAGIVVPRVPREPVLAITPAEGSALGAEPIQFFLEQISYPQSLDARTATLWGRSTSARLTAPWAPKISRQWHESTTVSAVVAELADLCAVDVDVEHSFPVCGYCYVVADQYPSEIIRDLAEKTGQELWPMPDGSVRLAPRAYVAGTVDAALDDAEMVIASVQRSVPEYGNRVLVSGDGAVAGLSVQVVPQYPDDDCVRADGASKVRLVALVVDSDGEPVADGTEVNWAASGGAMDADMTETGEAMITGEELQADDYQTVTLAMPAVRVLGVYAQSDRSRRMNLYDWRQGSVDGNVISFSQSLDYFDQSLRVDYVVAGAATNSWQAGVRPGDVTVLASVAGASGSVTVHQSNPTACPSTITMEAYPPTDGACQGDSVPVTVSVIQFGTEPGSGQAIFTLSGCGSLSTSRRSLSSASITENVVVTNVGAESQIQLRAIPSGDVVVYDPEESPMVDYYSATERNIVILNATLDEGRQLRAKYTGQGATQISWRPPEPTGNPGESPDCEATITCKVADGSEKGVSASVSVSARDCRELPEIDPEDPDVVPVTVDPCDSSTWPSFDPDDNTTWPPGWSSLDPSDPTTYPERFDYCDTSTWPAGFDPANSSTWPAWMGANFDPADRSTWLTKTFDPHKPSTWPAFDPYDKTTWPASVPQTSNFGDPSTWPEGFDPCAEETWPQTGICDPFDPSTLPSTWTGSEDKCDPTTWPEECQEEFDPYDPDTWPDEYVDPTDPEADPIPWPEDFDPGDEPELWPETPTTPEPEDPSTDPDSDTTPPDLDDEEEEPDATSCTASQITGRTPAYSGSWAAVAGVSDVSNCPGTCSCDEICSALRTAGKLNGQTYSQCTYGCAQARAQACTSCTLSGPTTLNPGEQGVWTDNKGNGGEYSGHLSLMSRTPDGYTLVMPSGGTGPFTVQVCYGSDARQCCEAEVNFPPCNISGPNDAAWGEEVVMSPGAGAMTGATATVNGLTLVRTNMGSNPGFVVSLPSGTCEGSITINLGGQVCGTRVLYYEGMNSNFTVTGPTTMQPGETAYFAHDGPVGCSYTGTLEVVEMAANSAVLRMPAAAEDGGSYSASWTGPCEMEGWLNVSSDSYDCDEPFPDCATQHASGALPIGKVVCLHGTRYRITSTTAGVNLCGDGAPFWCVSGNRAVDCPSSFSYGTWYVMEVVS